MKSIAQPRALWQLAACVTAIRHLFISPGHNFFGRFKLPAGEHAIHDVATVKCRAAWGLEGDRFYGYRPDYKGQVTFFAWETFLAAREKFGVPALSPSAFRRWPVQMSAGKPIRWICRVAGRVSPTPATS